METVEGQAATASVVVRRLAPVLGVALFGAALFVIHRELAASSFHEVRRQVESFPRRALLAALAISALGYLAGSGYDVLACMHVGRRLPWRRTALASFVGQALANNVGMALLSAGSVRFRLYAAWGFSASEIGAVIGFASVSFWLGFLVPCGALLLALPHEIPVDAPAWLLRAAGALLLVPPVAYLAWKEPLTRVPFLGGFSLAPPTRRLRIGQILTGVADWLLAAVALRVLLQAAAPGAALGSFPAFFGIFLVAQVVGIVSQVPGGLGVFEGGMLLMLARVAASSSGGSLGEVDPPPATVAAALVGGLAAFRLTYYVLPLVGAAVALGAHELASRQAGLVRVARGFGEWMPRLVPNVLAATTLVAGAVLLFSGATPAKVGRLAWLGDVLPLSVLEASHLLASVAGAALLLLARGLQRRLDAAWLLACGMLATGAAASLLKGLDWEEALLLTGMLAALIPCRRHFYRKASLLGEPFTAGWIAAIVTVMGASLWLAYFSFRHVEYSHELWWRFTFTGDAPRSLRAVVGAVGLALVFASARLLRPATRHRATQTAAQRDLVRVLVRGASQSSANLALLGDKSFLFSPSGDAFIMHADQGGSRVAMGDPVGAPGSIAELAWVFLDDCDRHGLRPVFYEVGPRLLPLYLDLGLTPVKIGEAARVHLPGLTLEGAGWKSQRNLLNRMDRLGVTMEVIPPEGVEAMLPALREVSDGWLSEIRTREKGFSLGRFDPSYLEQLPVAVVREQASHPVGELDSATGQRTEPGSGGRIVAFANLWPTGTRDEMSVDLMRHVPDAPAGVMEWMFLKLMLLARDEGYRSFDLGVAPLSGLESRKMAPLWARLGSLVYRHGESFYNFQGLRGFKEKFEPTWEPTYLATTTGLALPRAVADVAALVSGGFRGVLSR